MTDYDYDKDGTTKTVLCQQIKYCIDCLAATCLWSRKRNNCSHETDSRDDEWLMPGVHFKLCPSTSNYNVSLSPIHRNSSTVQTIQKWNHHDESHTWNGTLRNQHDNWNNPVSLSLLFLLAVLIAANILYLIRKVSLRLLPKYRRATDLFPLSEEDAVGMIQRH